MELRVGLSVPALATDQLLPTGLGPNCVGFKKKPLICLEGKSMTLHLGKTFLFRSFQQLLPLSHGHLKGFFELFLAALNKALNLLVRYFWNYRESRTPSGVPR